MLLFNGMNFTQWADMAIRIYTKDAMRRTGHRVVGTPHIFMGVLRDGPAAKLLIVDFNVSAGQTFAIVKKMPKPIRQGIGEPFLYTDGAKAVLEEARALAADYVFSRGLIYTEYLLVALLNVGDESFLALLDKLGVDRELLFQHATESLELKGKLVHQ